MESEPFNKSADIDAAHPVIELTHLCFGHRQDQRHRADSKDAAVLVRRLCISFSLLMVLLIRSLPC
jgi:hypothetical protein